MRRGRQAPERFAGVSRPARAGIITITPSGFAIHPFFYKEGDGAGRRFAGGVMGRNFGGDDSLFFPRQMKSD